MLKREEQWFLNKNNIEIVNKYKYLGLMFTPKLNWTSGEKILISQAMKAAGLIYSYNYKCGHLPVQVAITLFEKIIAPILLYGA